MRLSRKVLDAYNAAIKKQGDNAENAARKALEAWFEENPTATVADAREFSIALMNEVGSFYGNAAGDVAYALRDIAAEAAGVELEPVDYEYAPEAEYVSKAAHYQAGKLVDGDRPGFVDGIASSSRYFSERGANDTMAALGAADGKRLGKRVRFARVPTGATNCPFCIMLASRGFVYKSELSALNANHPHCDCRIVEGFDGMEVDGYDPDEYYYMWKHPEKYENESDEYQRNETSQHARVFERKLEGNRVSSGLDGMEAWLSKYQPESIRVEIDGDVILSDIGTAGEASFPQSLPNGMSYRRSHLFHTHTNPISGTFSDDDIETTVRTCASKHTLEHTLTGDKFVLTRTERATKASRKAFAKEYGKYFTSRIEDECYRAWVELGYKELQMPLPDSERRNVIKKLQPEFDHWLHENAIRFGYLYESNGVHLV